MHVCDLSDVCVSARQMSMWTASLSARPTKHTSATVFHRLMPVKLLVTTRASTGLFAVHSVTLTKLNWSVCCTLTHTHKAQLVCLLHTHKAQLVCLLYTQSHSQSSTGLFAVHSVTLTKLCPLAADALISAASLHPNLCHIRCLAVDVWITCCHRLDFSLLCLLT